MGKNKSRSQIPRLQNHKDFNYLEAKYQPMYKPPAIESGEAQSTHYRLGALVTISATSISGTVVLISGRTIGILDAAGEIHYVNDFETYPFQEQNQ